MKGYNESFKMEDGVLKVHLSGTFPKELLHEGKNLFQPLMDACSAHNCRKALIDARELQVDLGTMGLFQAGEDAAILAQMGLRIGFVAREDMLDTFFDTVVFNRGGNVGVFTDMHAAEEWLRGIPEGRHPSA